MEPEPWLVYRQKKFSHQIDLELAQQQQQINMYELTSRRHDKKSTFGVENKKRLQSRKLQKPEISLHCASRTNPRLRLRHVHLHFIQSVADEKKWHRSFVHRELH